MTATMPLENTIRPFAPVPIHPSQVTLPVAVPASVVQCRLGGSGGMTTSFSQGGGGFEFTSNQENFKESGRKSTLVRVENEDDPDQFIEFCRADKIELKPKDTKPPKPPRTSSYDPMGGTHGTSGDRDTRNYEFQYPKSNDKQCTPRNPPKGGDC